MTGEDLLEAFDRLADEVRNPALTLDLFTTVPGGDADDADDAGGDVPDGDAIAQALDPAELQNARRRRGALMFAANLVFDRILDDLVVGEGEREMLGVPRFTDEFLPARFSHRYDAVFLRKLLATAAKVSQDLADGRFSYPSCTAEELVLHAILQEWQALLDLTELGQSWTGLSEYLFEDLDFEYLFDADMDGVEDDPLAHKTSGIEVNALADWFVPFNLDSRVHPYAVDRHDRAPDLFDLTPTDPDGQHTLTDPRAPTQMPTSVNGLAPINDLVAEARREARTRPGAQEWIPDESDATRSFAQLAARPTVSGVLTHQAGPGGEITEAPVLSFTPHPAHPANGAAWAEVFYFSGRTELPLAAVVSFKPDPSVRQRWEAAFKPPRPDS